MRVSRVGLEGGGWGGGGGGMRAGGPAFLFSAGSRS